MKPSSSINVDRNSGLPSNPDRSALVISVVLGAALGIGLGFFSMAGWVGALVGGVLGAIGGGVIGKIAINRGHRQSAKDRALDREIGVIP